MRVHVFPHLTSAAPQGKDTIVDRVTLSSEGTCRSYQALASQPASTGVFLSSGKSFDFQVPSSGPVVDSHGHKPPKAQGPVWIECDSPVTVQRPGGSPSYSYVGAIYVRVLPASGTVDVINVLSVEDYLKGVVPGEMPAHWSAEALKAQAVAARTYAYFHALFARSQPIVDHPYYDVDDTTYYQAYEGFGKEDPRTNDAVDATEGELLLYQNSAIQAYFHADSGGYTEDADHVWPIVAPYCMGKPEVYPAGDGEAPWKVTLSQSEVNDKLATEGLIPNSNPVMQMSIIDRFASGRAKSVHLKLLDGSQTDIDGQVFHRIFGLKSTLISLNGDDPVNGAWTVTGKGWGHGVGMNQDGAQILASKMGWDYGRILDFYYTGLDLVNAMDAGRN